MPDPLAVLLLPRRLEEFALADHARDLLRAPRIVALEPGRVAWSRLAALPAAFALRTGLRQAKRLKLPGQVRVVILYDPVQALIALGLLARNPGAELWYLRGAEDGDEAERSPKLRERIEELEELVQRRADLVVSIDELAPTGPERSWFDANEPLWDRLEELDIAQFIG